MDRLRTSLRAGAVGAVVLALAIVELTTRSGVGWRLVTFTYQVNVLAAAYYMWSLISLRADRSAALRGAVVLYLVVAGVVWNLLLTERSMGYTPANILLHVVVPLLALADWLFVGHSQGAVRWFAPLLWLTYPTAYLALALMVLNNAGRRAPYYFLDIDTVGMAVVVSNVVLLAVGFLALGYLLSAVGRASVRVRSVAHP